VTALVGSNGANKSALLELAIGLLSPGEGTIEVLSSSPTREPEKVLPRVGFLAQEHPLYHGFSVEETLYFGKKTNTRWDDPWARRRIGQIGPPLRKNVGHLSGGQQAQLALAKRPNLMLLDEPIAGF
jgi:ABC-2 type transport system ATP-binding protein